MCSDTSRGSNTRCDFPGCSRTVWQDPDGSFSSFCGKVHRDAMAELQPAENLCQNCLSRPVYVENGRFHKFCGIRCAEAHASGRTTAISPRGSPRPASGSNICRLAGCNRPVYVSRDGVPGQFCSNAHRTDAVQNGKVEACLFCNQMPKNFFNGKESDFCSQKCGQDTIDYAPIILEVSPNYKAYQNVSTQFQQQWMHPTPVPKIVKIWKIFGNRGLSDQYSRYKLKVERSSKLKEGNERRRFHGTVRTCRLGDDGDTLQFCKKTTCSLCQIIKSSFEIVKSGQRFDFGRFGRGIYTSATSSKANDYVQQKVASPYRAMLLNRVVLGNTIKLKNDQPDLLQPPAGFDAVIGEPGGDLNYDEAIIYNNDAIRPMFLIVYQP